MACFNVMFTHHTNLATNVNPDLGPLFVLTKVVHLGMFNYPALVNYDYIMSGYVKITLTCNYRNIFPGSWRTRQGTEHWFFPESFWVQRRIEQYSPQL